MPAYFRPGPGGATAPRAARSRSDRTARAAPQQPQRDRRGTAHRSGTVRAVTDPGASSPSGEWQTEMELILAARDPAIGDFWTTRSLAELAEEQGVGVVSDVETLQDESISDEDAEAFITALGL